MTGSPGLVHDLSAAPGPDDDARRAVADRARRVLRPSGALARLDELAEWLAGWQRTARPRVSRPVGLVFAADHGVTAEGVSAYPAAVTAAMLRAFREQAATVDVLAREAGVRAIAVDVGVGRPTGNLAVEDALPDARFGASVAAGFDAVSASEADLLVLGEMGIGNTTAAAAVSAALFGGAASEWVGRGTGIDDEALARKTRAVERAVARIGPAPGPVEVLRRVGGAEMAAIAGAVVAARRRSIPTVLDGYVVTAAAAPLAVAVPGGLDHCVAGHRSPEPGHGRLLARLGLDPLLDLGMRLGEGSGAVAAVPLIRMAAAAVTDVPTFEEFGLDGR